MLKQIMINEQIKVIFKTANIGSPYSYAIRKEKNVFLRDFYMIDMPKDYRSFKERLFDFTFQFHSILAFEMMENQSFVISSKYELFTCMFYLKESL